MSAEQAPAELGHDAHVAQPRHVVVVDVETNGLDPARHEVVEVAWWNLATGERGRFVPAVDVRRVLHDADVEALQLNRYVDRLALAGDPRWMQELDKLLGHLQGTICEHGMRLPATLAGANPAFDAAFLGKLLDRARAEDRDERWMFPDAPPWHHRLWDLSAYAAGVLDLDELPGLSRTCELLGVEPGDHTAEADVTATGECFRRLQAAAATRRGLRDAVSAAADVDDVEVPAAVLDAAAAAITPGEISPIGSPVSELVHRVFRATYYAAAGILATIGEAAR